MLRRIQSQITTFLEQFKPFQERFKFKGKHLKDYNKEALDRCSYYKDILAIVKDEKPEEAALEKKALQDMQNRERQAKYEWGKVQRDLGGSTEENVPEPLSPYSPELEKYHASKETLEAINN